MAKSRFQIHLSTAVLITLAAGGWMYSNFQPVETHYLLMQTLYEREQNPSNFEGSTAHDLTMALRVHFYGFPAKIVMTTQVVIVENNKWIEKTALRYANPYDNSDHISSTSIVINTLLALVTLFVIWLVCERQIYRLAQ